MSTAKHPRYPFDFNSENRTTKPLNEQELVNALVAARHQLLAVMGLVQRQDMRRHIERAIQLADAALASKAPR